MESSPLRDLAPNRDLIKAAQNWWNAFYLEGANTLPLSPIINKLFLALAFLQTPNIPFNTLIETIPPLENETAEKIARMRIRQHTRYGVQNTFCHEIPEDPEAKEHFLSTMKNRLKGIWQRGAEDAFNFLLRVIGLNNEIITVDDLTTSDPVFNEIRELLSFMKLILGSERGKALAERYRKKLAQPAIGCAESYGEFSTDYRALLEQHLPTHPQIRKDFFEQVWNFI